MELHGYDRSGAFLATVRSLMTLMFVPFADTVAPGRATLLRNRCDAMTASTTSGSTPKLTPRIESLRASNEMLHCVTCSTIEAMSIAAPKVRTMKPRPRGSRVPHRSTKDTMTRRSPNTERIRVNDIVQYPDATSDSG